MPSPAWEAVMALAEESIATDGAVRNGRSQLAKVAPWAREVGADVHEAAAVVLALGHDVPPRDAQLVRACVQYGAEHGGKSSVPDFARWVCLSRRTVARRLRGSGLPSPRVLMRLGAVVYAARLVIQDPEPGGSVGRAARAVGLHQSSDLSRFVYAALGARPSQLRDARPAAIAARFVRHQGAEASS